MFVCKNNKSGTYSVQMVMTDRGSYVAVLSFSLFSDGSELVHLEFWAKKFIQTYGAQRVLDFEAHIYICFYVI